MVPLRTESEHERQRQLLVSVAWDRCEWDPGLLSVSGGLPARVGLDMQIL